MKCDCRRTDGGHDDWCDQHPSNLASEDNEVLAGENAALMEAVTSARAANDRLALALAEQHTAKTQLQERLADFERLCHLQKQRIVHLERSLMEMRRGSA